MCVVITLVLLLFSVYCIAVNGFSRTEIQTRVVDIPIDHSEIHNTHGSASVKTNVFVCVSVCFFVTI